MDVVVAGSRELRFDDGSPVRAASAIAPFGDGWLVVQDDATHAAWWRRAGAIERLRLFAPVDGHDLFSEAGGTKDLKPDLEAATEVPLGPSPGVLLLGSGSRPARMRGVLIVHEAAGVGERVADLSPLYQATAGALGIDASALNVEGACHVGSVIRLFNRGNRRAGLDSASVDFDIGSVLGAVLGEVPPGELRASHPSWYELGAVDGVGLAITDAASLPDGRVLVSVAAEDTPNAVDDGPVVAAGLAVLRAGQVESLALLPDRGVDAHKIEGLGVRHVERNRLQVLAVVDADDPERASAALDLEVSWG